ncbi:MAG: hypothetical protein HUN04_05535 [Desulfobacter sp.]|nr:MAG: hypothetical protein HUN04_05535 [Desulfobacter sp.]
MTAEKEYEFPRRIRRCFMTGKQCIFSSRKPLWDDADYVKGEEPREYNVFVVMPFRSNLDTFYEWSLKRYLKDGFNIDQPDKQIKRADEFRDIGYVMCEKICRRIQDANVIVVDLSIENANVMYELGISVGLGKQLLIVCNKSDKDKRINTDLMESIGLLGSDEVLEYPSVGYIDPEKSPPKHFLKRVNISPCNATMKIVPLVVSTAFDWQEDHAGSPDTQGGKKDIDVGFRDALRAAVGVAISDIDQIEDKPDDLDEAWRILKDGRQLDNLRSLGKNDDIELIDKNGKPAPFKKIAEVVDSAFTCIVDLAGENCHAYFWLGYCHARGINVIPVYRDVAKGTDRSHGSDQKRSLPAGEHSIAFDIRALWYIKFEQDNIKALATRLRSALEELIAKDIPRLQRNVFWERLTRHPTVHIYTGAVHHERLQREVVGDWDQRTVSELVRYLSSAEESVVPELERPIYSPETIKKKLNNHWDDSASLDEYVKLVKNELQDKNCLIVASADVNPLTEIILAHAYGLKKARFSSADTIEMSPQEKNIALVALKGWQEEMENNDGEGQNRDNPHSPIPTFFSRPGKVEGIEENNRGFFTDNRVIGRPYKSQDQVQDEPFSLLSHLLVMKNPFSKKKPDTLITLLNGVSGPATFALAEVLTGGKSPEKAVDCEKLLSKFNQKWSAVEKNGKNTDELFGVQGIIEVDIQPKRYSGIMTEAQANGSGSPEQKKITVDDKFFDKREVLKWGLLKTDNPDETLALGNPHAFTVEKILED